MAEPKVIRKILDIPEPVIHTAVFTLKGSTPLIMHEWSEKAKKQIRDKQQKKAKPKKEARKPKEEYESAKIKNSKGELSIKAIWIKSAMVKSARFVENLPMTLLRGALFVQGDDDELIKLRYKKEEMVEDTVRLSGIGRSADLRYRPYIYGWEADVTVEYDGDVLTLEQLTHLLMKAGFSNGIGENRPERSGDNYGRFTVHPFKSK